MERAYAQFELKALEGEGKTRSFSGVASTPTPDRVGDIVLPKGAQFKLPIPLLYQHDMSQPIGWVKSAKVTDKGITVEGEVALISEDGPLKSRLDEAWQAMKYGLVKGLSIGFRPLKSARIGDTWSYEYSQWEWHELSAVTIPCNADATITAIKAADMQHRKSILVPVTKTVWLDGAREQKALDEKIAERNRKTGVVYLK